MKTRTSSYPFTTMPLFALSHTLRDARTRWLNGDVHAWTRYVECCLQLEAELRKAQRTSAVAPAAPSDRSDEAERPNG